MVIICRWIYHMSVDWPEKNTSKISLSTISGNSLTCLTTGGSGGGGGGGYRGKYPPPHYLEKFIDNLGNF